MTYIPNRWHALSAMLLTFVGVLSSAPSASALIKVKCGPPMAIAAVDPIVNHNESGKSKHQHQIFGNNSWAAKGNSATYQDLLAGSTECRESTDTAGYWTPTLLYTAGPNKGRMVPVQQFTAYYRGFTNRGSTGPGRAYPADTRLVSEPGRYNWTCGEKSGPRSAPVSVIPDCRGLSGKPGLTLTAHIDFPSCWSGVMPKHSSKDVGDTRDNAQYRYVENGKCPPTHPIPMVALRETIQFQYVGDGKDVALASDLMAGTSGGRTMHGDFWNAWQQADFERLVKMCVNSAGPASTCDK